MRLILFLFAAGLLAAPAKASAQKLVLGKYVKVFSGKEGAKVALVTAGKDLALLKISGVENELDGLAVLCTVKPGYRNGKSYVTKLHGRDWHIFAERPTRWGNGSSYRLRLYGTKASEVYYDEKASKKVRGATLAALYKRHKKGKLAKLAKFNRKMEIAAAKKELKSRIDRVAKACGKAPVVSVDWKSVSDEIFKKTSIASYCGDQLYGLTRACKADERHRKYAGMYGKAICHFGDKQQIVADKGTLHFHINTKAANQSDRARYVLENILQ